MAEGYFDRQFIAMAHRGGPLLAENVGKENTLRAFENAWRLGYRHMETDVHLTKDGQLVAFHDAELERVTGRPGGIGEHSYAQLRDISVGGEPIPLMSELFEALPGARFNIDIKMDGAEEPLAHLVNWHQARHRVCVASFSSRRIRRFRRYMGARVATTVGPVGTSMTVGRVAAGPLAPPGLVYQVPEHHTVAGRPVRIVSPAFIDRVHRLGKFVHVWTVNQRADMERLIDWGVDGLIVDSIDVLKDVLVGRGLWDT